MITLLKKKLNWWKKSLLTRNWIDDRIYGYEKILDQWIERLCTDVNNVCQTEVGLVRAIMDINSHRIVCDTKLQDYQIFTLWQLNLSLPTFLIWRSAREEAGVQRLAFEWRFRS